jgi:hypothetical protein
MENRIYDSRDDVKKLIKDFKYSADIIEKIQLYFDEHGNFRDCPFLKADQIEKLKNSDIIKKRL